MQLKGASPCLVERSVRLQFVSKRPAGRRSWWGPSPNYPVPYYDYSGSQVLSGWSRNARVQTARAATGRRAAGKAGADGDGGLVERTRRWETNLGKRLDD